MNTFNGIQFMSLDRTMYLKIQCLLNYLEEQIPIVNKTVVMHQDQVIWSGLEQDDVALIYNFLKELVITNLGSSLDQKPGQNPTVARFLQKQYQQQTGTSACSSVEPPNDYFEFEKVYLGKPLEKFLIIPYNLNKLTFFIFIQVSQNFQLSILSKIDEILAPHMVTFLQEILEQKLRRSQIM